MTPTFEFWMTWFVQVAIAVGTIGAVLVALFGPWLRGRFASPRLVLKLENTDGVATPVKLAAPDGSTRETTGRLYHVRLYNERSWSPATQVQVALLGVEEPDAAGEFRFTWLGDIPIRRRDQGIKPLVHTAGHAEDYDLCSVVRDKWVELHPLAVPFALVARRNANCELIATLQARGVEASSEELRVKIAWDGHWSEDTDQMRRHMVVKEVRKSG